MRKADQLRASDATNGTRHDAVAASCDLLLTSPTLNLAGPVFLSHDLQHAETLARLVRDRGLQVLGEAGRMRASLYVVESLRAISHRDEWTAVLSGGSIVDSGFFMRGGKGASIAVQPAVATPRRIWISDKFRELHPGLGKVMDAAISIPVSKWT